MKIELVTQRLIEDMRVKSHLEAQRIQDLVARDEARIDEDDMDEIRRDLVTALSMLHETVGRYLRTDLTYIADDSIGLPSIIALDFSFAERRMDGKAQALADAIHAYLVDATLSLFYNTVEQTELAAKRARLAQADSQLVERLVYTKRPPYQIINH